MLRSALIIALTVLCSASPALAHSQVPGVNAFTGGLLEPFFQPMLIVGVVALAVMAGGTGMRHISPIFAAFVLALVAGMLARSSAPPVSTRLLLLALVVIGAGGWAALSRPVPLLLGIALAVACGLMAGFELGPHEDEVWSRIMSGFGSVFALVLLLLNAVALVTFIFRKRYVIVIRVAGAWCAAIGILLAARGFMA